MHSAPSSDRRSLFQRLLGYLGPYRSRLVLGLVCGGLAAPIMPMVMKQASRFIKVSEESHLAQADRIAAVLPICFGLVGFYTLLIALRFGQGYFLTETSLRLGMRLRREIFTHLQKMPLAFFHQQRTGALMTTLTADVERLQNSARLLRDGIALPVTALTCLILLWRTNYQLTLFTLVAVPIMALVIRQLTKKVRSLTTEGQERLGEVATVLEETLSAPRVVKAFSAETRETERFEKTNEAAVGVSLRIARRTALLSPLVDWIGSIAIAVILYVGTVMRVGADEFVAFIAVANQLANSVSGLGNLRSGFEELAGAAERIYREVLDVPSTLLDAPDATAFPPITGEVVFENITFGYDPAQPVLSGIDLTIAPGAVVALVGATGAGKSTLADLIPRFYDPTAGRVLVDGVDIKTVTIHSLRQQIGIVPQDTILFSGTIQSNIAYGKPEATQDEIETAARAANAHEFILAQPDGYQTIVGERGVTLSGGQKQRLAIARALLTNPRILIFDEATSALDTQTESVVQEALGTWFKGRTTVIIAHRLSTIVNADKIVVLQHGSVAEQGTHAELLVQSGLYAALYDAQQKGVAS